MKCNKTKYINATEEEIENYINRELVRPNTTKKEPIIIAICLLIIPLIIAIIFCNIDWVFSNYVNYKFMCFFISYSITFIIGLKYLLISIIKCYQHYAPEETRRLCLCVPSCSEYAIVVLKKYFIVVAIYKIIKRLVKTCDGNYKIDEP